MEARGGRRWKGRRCPWSGSCAARVATATGQIVSVNLSGPGIVPGAAPRIGEVSERGDGLACSLAACRVVAEEIVGVCA